MKPSLARPLRWLAIFTAIGLPIVAAFLLVAFEATSQPSFCGSCHNMAPYYDSWLTSSHSEIPCVDCHIPPGISSTLRKKYEAMAMVASYFTGTYATKPWAEIDDASCLRSGCHAKRLLLGRERFGDVLFDHQPHLAELRRGKQLRCTSCHSQIVQGSHISVTASTCYLCHFRDTKPNTGTARCSSCHDVPDRLITTAGLSFDHGDVGRYDMECMDCHEGIVQGNGPAPRDRCLTCHNEAERLSRYGDTDFLHNTHIAEHKVACMHCHIEVQHQIPEHEEALATGCPSCHTSEAGHSAVRDLYRGIGGQDVDPQPAAMYLAGIRCEACHNRLEEFHRSADEVSCMSCHGPEMLTIYRTWMAGLDARLEGLTREIEEVRAWLTENGKEAEEPLLARAEENLELLRRGRPIHNPPYSLALVEKTHRDLVQAAGSRRSLPRAWVEAGYESECLQCHFGIELVDTRAFGAAFSHEKHVVSAGIRCRSCHGDMDEHGTLSLEEDDCGGCHLAIVDSMAGASPERCLECHVADIGPISEKVRFPHEKHAALGFACSFCHPGVDTLPHHQFAENPERSPEVGHDFCRTCHAAHVPAADGTMPDGANCALCHVSF